MASYSAYVGGGAIRFYLPLDVQLDNNFVAQMVVVATDLEARDRVEEKLETALAGFDTLTARVSRLELGPPVGWPLQYRVSGNTLERGARIRRSGGGGAQEFRDSRRRSISTGTRRARRSGWSINQDRARQLGLSSEDIAQQLYTIHNGATVTQIRDSIYLIDIVARATDTDRLSLESLRGLQLNLPSGQAVPLIDVGPLRLYAG